MKTLEVSYLDMVSNTPRVRPGSNIYREVRTSVRTMNRSPRRTVHVVLTLRPGNTLDVEGRRFMITRNGRLMFIGGAT